MSNIVARVVKNKRFKDKEVYFEFDDRFNGQTFQSNAVCLDNDDLEQLALELTGAVNQLLGQVLNDD